MTASHRDGPTLSLLRALYRSFHAVNCADARNLEERWGLQLSEFDVLATLGNTEGVRMGEIASRTLCSPANVTRLVKRLEGRGLVRRERSPSSDREVIARLTPVGVALFDEAYPAQVEFLRIWFDERLDQNQQAALRSILGTLQAATSCCEQGDDE